MFTVPSETCFKPSPDPPASIVMETSGYFSMNMSAASSTSGFNAEEPAAVMEPVSAAASVAAAAAVVDGVEVFPPPHAVRPNAMVPANTSANDFFIVFPS